MNFTGMLKEDTLKGKVTLINPNKRRVKKNFFIVNWFYNIFFSLNEI